MPAGVRLLTVAVLLAAGPVAAQSRLFTLSTDTLTRLQVNNVPLSSTLAQCIVSHAPVQGQAAEADDDEDSEAELNDAIAKTRSSIAALASPSPRQQFFKMATLFYDDAEQQTLFTNAAMNCRTQSPR